MKRKLFCIAAFCGCMLLTGCPSKDDNSVDASKILSEMQIGEPECDSESEENIPTVSDTSSSDNSAAVASPKVRTENTTATGTSVPNTPPASRPVQTPAVPSTAASAAPNTTAATAPQTRPADSHEFTAPKDTGANDSDFNLEDFGIGAPSTVGKDNGVNTVPYDENIEIEDWFLI